MGKIKGSLGDLRKQIDQLDQELVTLLNKRAELVEAIGELKSVDAKPVYDPVREKQILQKIQEQNRGPLSNDALKTIFAGLISCFRAWEQSHRPLGDFSDLKSKSVSIIGLGLIGFSLAKRLKKVIPDLQLQGFDIHEHPDLTGPFAHSCSRLEDALNADIVILATPVLETIEIIKDFGVRFKKGSLVMDTASTKESIVKTAKAYLPPQVTFIGGHPLAGKSVSGPEEAEESLFVGHPFVLTPGGSPDSPQLRTAKQVVAALGAREIVMEARLHDQVLALTSHLPQLVSTNLAILAQNFSEQWDQNLIYGPAFRDMTRLASSDFKMWQGIAITNSDNILALLKAFESQIRQFKKTVKSGRFEKEFNLAKKFKETKVA